MQDNLDGSYANVEKDDARKVEDEINYLRSKFRKQHLKSIEKGDYNIKAGLIFVDLISSAEKLGDHIYDVNSDVRGDSV